LVHFLVLGGFTLVRVLAFDRFSFLFVDFLAFGGFSLLNFLAFSGFSFVYFLAFG